MKKLLCIFLIIITCSSFVFSVYAADEVPASAGTGYIIFDNGDSRDLSIATNTLSFDTQNGFDLYFPYLVYQHSEYNGCYVIYSGSLFFDTSNGANSSRTYDFSTVYPTSLKFDLNDDGTYKRTIDLSTSYDSGDGYTDFENALSNFSSQMHYFDDGITEGFIITYIFIQRSQTNPIFRDATITFNTPSISDGTVRSSNFKCLTVARPSDAVEDAINTMNQSTIQGLGGVQSAVNALSTLTQSNFASTEQLLNSLDSAISDLKGSVTDSVYNALDEWHQHELDFVQSDMNPIVQGVVDDINNLYDYDTLYNAFNSVVNMVTGGNTRAAPTTRLRIPAGVVTVAGNTYRFWEETYVDFGPIFENSMIQLLLVPFRFLLAYGFLRYCMYWINKLINTITLHIKAGDY